MAVKDYNTDPAKNTAISGINIAENCPPGNVNNAIRQEMADTKAFYDEYASFKGTTVSKSGDTVSGTLNVTGEIQNAAKSAFRQVYGNYGTYWYSTGTGLYLMVTDSGNQYGTYNSLRPLTVNLSTGDANISGNAATATTATKLTTPRTISLTGGVTGSASFDGSANVSITTTVGNTSGNAATAAKLATARTIAISGGATGTATSFDGSSNIAIPVTSLDVSKATAGTLPIARGGTGATTAAAARTALGITLPASGIAPMPQNASGVGQLVTITASATTIPSGGTWAVYLQDSGNNWTASVLAGGSSKSTSRWGFGWRVS